MTAVPIAVVIDGSGMHARVRATLTDEHPAATDGTAVLLINDMPYGPHETLSIHNRPVPAGEYILQTVGDGWDTADLLWLRDQQGWRLSAQLLRLIAVAERRPRSASGSYGASIRTKRQSLGLTQADLAELLEVSANTVARWERGEVCPQHPRVLEYALDMLMAQLRPTRQS